VAVLGAFHAIIVLLADNISTIFAVGFRAQTAVFGGGVTSALTPDAIGMAFLVVTARGPLVFEIFTRGRSAGAILAGAAVAVTGAGHTSVVITAIPDSAVCVGGASDAFIV